ncbi:MAG: hypothetical protein ABI091_24570, partial [Ferruginibacter sp.]
KAVAKKAMAKKTAPKKSIKKAAPEKAAPKKAAAKKTAPVKQAVPKNAPPKKGAPKKAVPKKAVAKQSKPITKSTPAKPAVNTPAPAPSPMPEMNNEVQAPAQDENIVNTPAVSDPITVTDQKVYNKATFKVDPKHNMPVSSTRKGGVKPSGKKPMW